MTWLWFLGKIILRTLNNKSNFFYYCCA